MVFIFRSRLKTTGKPGFLCEITHCFFSASWQLYQLQSFSTVNRYSSTHHYFTVLEFQLSSTACTEFKCRLLPWINNKAMRLSSSGKEFTFWITGFLVTPVPHCYWRTLLTVEIWLPQSIRRLRITWLFTSRIRIQVQKSVMVNINLKKY